MKKNDFKVIKLFALMLKIADQIMLDNSVKNMGLQGLQGL